MLLPGDLADADFCRSLVEDAVEGLGGLDALVNNAGRQIAVESLEEIDDQQWTETFEVNIHAMFRITQAALAHLPAGSTIVNTTSIQAYQPSPTLVDYASTKAAINNFTRVWPSRSPARVRVNAVAPGPIWTPLQVSDGQPKACRVREVHPAGPCGPAHGTHPRTSSSPPRSRATCSARPSRSRAGAPAVSRHDNALLLIDLQEAFFETRARRGAMVVGAARALAGPRAAPRCRSS